MSNFTGKINLLKLKKSCVMALKGKESYVKCVVIPIEENQIYITEDDRHQAKGAYLDFMAYENQNSQYGDTHSLRQTYPKEVRERMTDDEKKKIPYIGNLRPFVPQNAAASVQAPAAQAYMPLEDEDLIEPPF